MADDEYALLAAWRAAIAETDAVRGAAQYWHPGDQVMIQHAEHRECTAGRAYLAARDRAVAAQVTCSGQGPGVADFAGDNDAG